MSEHAWRARDASVHGLHPNSNVPRNWPAAGRLKNRISTSVALMSWAGAQNLTARDLSGSETLGRVYKLPEYAMRGPMTFNRGRYTFHEQESDHCIYVDAACELISTARQWTPLNLPFAMRGWARAPSVKGQASHKSIDGTGSHLLDRRVWLNTRMRKWMMRTNSVDGVYAAERDYKFIIDKELAQLSADAAQAAIAAANATQLVVQIAVQSAGLPPAVVPTGWNDAHNYLAPVQAAAFADDESICCVICMVNPRQTAFSACGHMVSCVHCTNVLVGQMDNPNRTKCPVCRVQSKPIRILVS